MHHRSEGRSWRHVTLRTGVPAMGIAAMVTLAAHLFLVEGGRLQAQEGAAPEICDPGLASRSEDPRAYRLRGDRCEGIFRLKVSSDKLRIRSWTAWFEDYDYQDSTPLRVTWTVPPGSEEPVRLRADTLKPRTFYRMDTLLSPFESPWVWPTRFLAQIQLGRGDLGIVGWTELPIAEDGRLYLPLEIHQRGKARPDGYRVALVPGERLREVLWSVAPVLKDGSIGSPLSDPRALGYPYYPAERPTVFPIPAPAREGLYVFRLHAASRSGRQATRTLWFYHPESDGRADAGIGAAP